MSCASIQPCNSCVFFSSILVYVILHMNAELLQLYPLVISLGISRQKQYLSQDVDKSIHAPSASPEPGGPHV